MTATTESKKLLTMPDPNAEWLYSIALSGDPEEGLLEHAEPAELLHDTRIAHEQRKVLREQQAQLIHLHPDDHDGWAVCDCGTARAIRAAAPFLED